NARDFSHGKICAFVVAGEEDDHSEATSNNDEDGQGENGDSDLVVIGASGADATKQQDQTIKMEVGPSDVVDGRAHYVGVSFLNSGAECPFELGDRITDETEFSHLAMLAFKVDNNSLRTGLSGTLYETGPFATKNVKIQVE